MMSVLMYRVLNTETETHRFVSPYLRSGEGSKKPLKSRVKTTDRIAQQADNKLTC